MVFLQSHCIPFSFGVLLLQLNIVFLLLPKMPIRAMQLVAKLRANTTLLEGRVFGYTSENKSHPLSFYSATIVPSLDWMYVHVILSQSPGFVNETLRCISFGFNSVFTDWSVDISEMRIYRYPYNLTALNY